MLIALIGGPFALPRGQVDQLARDIVSAFPETQGFSARSLWRLRAFYPAHPAPP